MRTFPATSRFGQRLSLRCRFTVGRLSRAAGARRRLIAAQAGSQAGFMLLEVMISALLVAFIAVGTLNGFDAAGHVSADERAHAEANLLVQQDQDRLKSLTAVKLAELAASEEKTHQYKAANGSCVEEASKKWRYCTGEKRSYTGAVFTIHSSARFISAAKESAACEGSEASANYIETKSTASWTTLASGRPEVSQSSVITPPTSLTGLFVKVKNQFSEPVSGIEVVLKGATNHTATTPSTGCVLFLAIPAENYALSAGTASYVDQNASKPPASKALTVAEGKVTTAEFVIASPGNIKVEFENPAAKTEVESDTFVAAQAHVSAPSFFLGGEAAKRKTSVTLEGLFPFSIYEESKWKPEGYAVYAGDCEANNPKTVTASSAEHVEPKSALVEAGKTAEVTVEAPPVTAIAYEGTEKEVVTEKKEIKIKEAKIAKLYNTECKASVPHNHPSLTTERSVLPLKGELEVKFQPQPYGKLELCVITPKIGTKFYEAKATFTNELKAGTKVKLYMKTANKGKSGSGNNTVEYLQSEKEAELKCP